MTSTYRDLAGFLGPLAPEAGRVANSSSSGSTFPEGGGKVDVGLDGGKESFGVAAGAGGAAEVVGV